ncbi:hypothetical protein P7K49_040542, partial [Saguinus oedipus]
VIDQAGVLDVELQGGSQLAQVLYDYMELSFVPAFMGHVSSIMNFSPPKGRSLFPFGPRTIQGGPAALKPAESSKDQKP